MLQKPMRGRDCFQDMKRHFETLTLIIGVAVVYYWSGKLGQSLAYVNVSTSAVWPPTGLALAAMLLWGWRLWPAVFIGSFLVDISAQGSWLVNLGVATGDTLEALVAVTLVRRFAGGVNCFERPRSIFKFILFAAVFSTMISATVGVLSLGLGHCLDRQNCWTVWSTWWMGNLASDVVIAPLLLIWATRRPSRPGARRLLEGAALVLTLALIGRLVFQGRSPYAAIQQLEYLIIPPLLWATFRFGLHGAITSVCGISGLALWGTLRHLGPFASSDPNESLLLLQIFTVIIAMTVMVLSAVIAERQRFLSRLQVQDAISRILAESPDLREATPKILQVLGECAGWDLAAMWRLDRTASKLVCSDVWSADPIQFFEFETATRQIRFAPGIGLPGRVWLNGQPAWIRDVNQDVGFQRRPAAAQAGLHTAFGVPIKSGCDFLGVMEFYRCEIHPSANDFHFIDLLVPLGLQIGQFTKRKQAEADLRVSEKNFQQVTESIREVFWLTNLEKTEMIYISPAYEKIWGRSCASLCASPRDWLLAVHPEDRGRMLAADQDHPVDGELSDEFRILRPDGSIRWILSRAFPVPDESGKVYRIAGIAEDITVRKQAETDLALLAHGIESTSELICITDLEDRFMFTNPAFREAYGYTTEEIIGKSPALLSSPGTPPDLLQQIMAQSRAGGWRGEVLNRRKNGTDLLIHLQTSQVKDRTGKVIALMGVAEDITARKRAEQVLIESEARLRLINEQVPALIWTVDRELRLTSAAGLSSAETRVMPHELVGRPLHEVYGTTDENFPGIVAHRGALNGERNEVELQFENHFWRCNVEPLVGSGGEIIGCVGVAMNITEAKQKEARLQELAAIVQGSEDGIVSLTPEGIVISWNKGAERLLGYAAGEMVGNNVAVIFPPQELATARQTIHQVMRGESVESYETVRVHKDGGLRYVSVSLSPVTDVAGKIISLAAIYRDIQKQKQLEKAVQEIIAISVNQQRRIGHDLHDGLGQHLAGVAFRAKALEESLAAHSPGLAREAARILDLVNEGIKQTRQLARGLDPVDMEVDGLPAALQELAVQTTERFQLACDFRCQQARMTMAAATSLGLYRIAQEAVHNAVSHGKARRIVIDLDADATGLCLKIQDNGQGFQTANRSGPGMGLRIMQYRANTLGGSLSIHSQINAGTEVICVVPEKTTLI